MKKRPTICICGGGNLGTVIAGIAGAEGYSVNILTGHPEKWDHEIKVTDTAGHKFVGHVACVSSNAKDVIPQSDIILCCLPGSIISSYLINIKPYLSPTAIVGSVFSNTGFFITAISIFNRNTRLFGFQRVPFIARIREYGHSAVLLSYRKTLNVAFWEVSCYEQEAYAHELSEILRTPVRIMDHALQATLTNSNPILHPSRLYSLFKDFDIHHPYKTIPHFYEDWDNDSSEILIQCDNEFQRMLQKIGLASDYTPPLLKYYESTDAPSLTRKIKSILSLKGIKAPMVACDGGYAPDWNNRYFSEDIPYGMLLIKYICQMIKIPTPNIDKIVTWYQEQVGQRYLANGIVIASEDVKKIACLNQESLQILFQSMRKPH